MERALQMSISNEDLPIDFIEEKVLPPLQNILKQVGSASQRLGISVQGCGPLDTMITKVCGQTNTHTIIITS